MTHQDLKQVILDYFRTTYEVEFIGKLEIEDLYPTGYKVKLYLDNDYYPVVIISDLPDEKFIPFIKEELRSRKFHKTQYFALSKLPKNFDTALSMPNVKIIRQIANQKPQIIKTNEEIMAETLPSEWIGTIEEFNALGRYHDNVIYIIVI